LSRGIRFDPNIRERTRKAKILRRPLSSKEIKKQAAIAEEVLVVENLSARPEAAMKRKMKAKQEPKMKIPVRRWAYELWRANPGKILVTLPSDGEKLEALIQERSECTVMFAFILFITADPPLYHFEPVDHVDTFVSKKGNTVVTTHTDEAAITHFALALFISKSEGYLVEAEFIISGGSETMKPFFKNHEWAIRLPLVNAIIRSS